MKSIALITIVLLTTLSTGIYGQKENKHIRSGNGHYAENDFKNAELDYLKALEAQPGSYKGQYNLGGALYKQGNYEDAGKIYGNLASGDRTDESRAAAYYNLGNSLVQSEKYDEAVDAYKNALRLTPEDMDAKYNMEFAKRMIRQQQNKDQQQDQDKEGQDKQQQDKNNQDQQPKEEDQQQQDQQQQQQKEHDQQQQQQQQMSKKDAERMLEALKNDEQKTLEKIRLQQMMQGKKVQTEKDW
ncbi:MAG: tetratricopeptide repeat protein [Bacteroidales bacterium]|nr:tetratricopeptide repeat protein [Bacteroidales bacterium]